jgi:hypothetical protein
MSGEEARRLEGLLFDLDDTFLDHGKLLEGAYAALFELRKVGLKLVVATGRPAGWGELLARIWPVHAVVSENGAIAHFLDRERVRRVDEHEGAERTLRRKKLIEIAGEVQQQFPELASTDDAHARLTDLTFDIGEHNQVEASVVERAMALTTKLGGASSRSSVHMHVTLDRHDKATGSLAALRGCLGIDSSCAARCGSPGARRRGRGCGRGA